MPSRRMNGQTFCPQASLGQWEAAVPISRCRAPCLQGSGDILENCSSRVRLVLLIYSSVGIRVRSFSQWVRHH